MDSARFLDLQARLLDALAVTEVPLPQLAARWNVPVSELETVAESLDFHTALLSRQKQLLESGQVTVGKARIIVSKALDRLLMAVYDEETSTSQIMSILNAMNGIIDADDRKRSGVPDFRQMPQIIINIPGESSVSVEATPIKNITSESQRVSENSDLAYEPV